MKDLLAINNQNPNPEKGIWTALRGGLVGAAIAFYLICFTQLSWAGGLRAIAVAGPLAGLKPEARNGDYINDIKAGPVDPSLNSEIFEVSIAREMREKFIAFDREYQIREAYQLNSPNDYLRYEKSNKDLAEWTLKKLIQHHFDNTLKTRVEQSMKREIKEGKSGSTRTAAQAVMTVSKIHKALQNTTLNIGESLKTRFRYDFPSGLFQFSMKSPVFDANMDYHIKAGDPTVGNSLPPERMNVNLSRNFEFLSASTTFNYALISQNMNYGVNKSLVGPLSAQVDQSHRVHDPDKDETVFRLNLGTSF